MLGEIQPRQPGQNQGQVGRRGLRAVPQVPPRAAEVEQDQAAEQHQPVVQGEIQGSAGAGVDEADQVMQDEHHQAAEQHAEQQGLAMVGGGYRCGFQAYRRAQLVLRDQAQVNVQRVLAVGQGQYMVAAAQGRAAVTGLAAVVQLAQQPVAIEGVEVEARQVRSEDAQQLLLVTRFQAIVQPQGLFSRCGIEFAKGGRAELAAIAIGTHVAQLQVGLFIEQNGPASALFGRSRQQAEQGQQADDQSCGNPKPTHYEIPS